MVSTDPLRDLVERITALLPARGLAIPQAYGEELRLLLQGVLARGEWVTRDEFDAQVAVLHRAEARLRALEGKLAALEAEGASSTDAPA
jgi:BMFP domain-containing protein YqiC